MKRIAWSADDRREYDELMTEVVTATSNTTERLNMFERLLNDAVQAQRPWARSVERGCVRHGLAKEIKSFQDRNRAMVAYNGAVLNVPRVQSTVVRDDSGEVYYQRGLIELWTWDQIADKRTEALTGKRTYDAKIAHYDRLLALHAMCPESSTPAEAARLLKLNLDEYLGLEAAS